MAVGVHIGISEKGRKEVAQRLNLLLANEYVLYTKTLKYHWNIKGPFFGPLHELFGKQYEQLLHMIDDIAERAQQLGFEAVATLKEFLKVSTIKEEPGVYPDDKGMIKNLLNDQEAIIRQIREDIDHTTQVSDAGTNNFLSELIEKHEKMAWMLRSHLQ